MPELSVAYPSADRHEMELRAANELERLPGALAAGVWLTGDGQLRAARIHILPGVAPTIVINAASRVMQALNIEFQQRDIRTAVLTLPDDLHASAGLAIGGSSRFLILQDVTTSREGSHVTCRVQVMREDRPATGEARELDTPSGRARAAANATLRAAENAADNLALGLEAAAFTEFFGRRYAVVSVEGSVGRRAATLSGIVPLEPTRAPEESVAMATLKAIDRWIGF